METRSGQYVKTSRNTKVGASNAAAISSVARRALRRVCTPGTASACAPAPSVVTVSSRASRADGFAVLRGPSRRRRGPARGTLAPRLESGQSRRGRIRSSAWRR